MIEEVEEKNQFLIAKVNKFKANEEIAMEREKKQKEQIKAREASIKLLNQTVANFRADLAAATTEIAAIVQRGKAQAGEMADGSGQAEDSLSACCKLVEDLHTKYCLPERQ
jgi:hypothetical protein